MTDLSRAEVAALLQAMLQQQTAMLGLQRMLVERLVGGPSTKPSADPSAGIATAAISSTAPAEVVTDAPEPAPQRSALEASPPRQPDPMHADMPIDYRPSESNVDAPPSQSPAADQNVARGARYYQPRPSPAAKIVKPEELELMWRLQEMRAVCNHFRPRRHRMSASTYRQIRTERHIVWQDVTLGSVRH